jgi:hypothetical protein
MNEADVVLKFLTAALFFKHETCQNFVDGRTTR